MKKLIVLIPLFVLAIGAQAAFCDDSYFPLDKDRVWAFDDGNNDRIVSFLRIQADKVSIQAWAFDPYNFAKRVFFRDGNKIFESKGNFKRLWYDFGAAPKTTWKMVWTPIVPAVGSAGANSTPPEEIADINDGAEVTLIANNETVTVPFGSFKGAAHLKIVRPRVADASYVEEWFVPGVGCVQRVWDTIAGPHMQKLLKVAVPPPPEENPLRLDVKLDKETYKSGEDIQIEVTALNWSDKDITIEFNSSLQVDYYIDGLYQWSKGKAFTTALTSVKIPARDVFKWTFTHKSADLKVLPGRHSLTATLLSKTVQLKAAREFTVASDIPALPAGVKLTVKTDKTTYNRGEPVIILLTAENKTDKDITIKTTKEHPIRYTINDVFRYPAPDKALPATVDLVIPAGKSAEFKEDHTAEEFLLEPGYYIVNAGLVGYDVLVPAKFNVTKELTLGKVDGVVVAPGPNDEKSLLPVPGAEVVLNTEIPKNYEAALSNMPRGEKIEFTAKTDDKGAFSFTGIPVGVFYTLTVKKDGFYPYQETIRTLEGVTSLKVQLKPAKQISDAEMNVKRHTIAGLLVSMGTDQSVYKPDSPFKAVFSVRNTLQEDVKFIFAGDVFVDWYLDLPKGPVQLTVDEVQKPAGAAADVIITLKAGDTREFVRKATLKGKVPENGGKYAVRASLRYTSCSIQALKPGDVTDYVNILVVPNQSSRIEAQGHNKEMMVDLKTTQNATINIVTKNDGVAGGLAVTEIKENLHKAKAGERFVKMIEVDADSTIRADMDSANVRIYFDRSEFSQNFDPRNLKISHWDDKKVNPEWEELSTKVDTVNNFVEATTSSFSSFALFESGGATGVADTDSPSAFRLDQNVPNPFNPSTSIRFTLPAAGVVILTVYNITGQEVARLVDGVQSAGSHFVMFDGSRFASGVYFYRISAPGFSQARKMLLIK